MNNNSNLFTNNIFNLMDKRANLYFAALLGAMSPICAAPAFANQTYSATALQQ